MKTVFITFADSRMTPTLVRIKEQAEDMKFFDEIYAYSEKNLDKDFRKKYKNRVIKGSRGYGYWIWKPYIIKKALDNMNNGDRLLYIDAGCHLNPRGKKRMEK